MKYLFSTVLFQDTCELIHFKFGMMLNTTKLYSLLPVCMTFLFTQGHRVMVKLEFVQSFSCRLHETTQMFMMVDYVYEEVL